MQSLQGIDFLQVIYITWGLHVSRTPSTDRMIATEHKEAEDCQQASERGVQGYRRPALITRDANIKRATQRFSLNQ